MVKRILVVDDNEGLRVDLTHYLSGRGFVTDCTATCSAALSLLQTYRYDVVLTEVWLPDREGCELLRQIHACAPGAIVIVMTTSDNFQSAVEAFRCGVYDCLPKPFSLDDLVQRLETIGRFDEVVRADCLLRQEIQRQYEPGKSLVGRSKAITDIVRTIKDDQEGSRLTHDHPHHG
jgi:DNA-binding NtrC family response regulator